MGAVLCTKWNLKIIFFLLNGKAFNTSSFQPSYRKCFFVKRKSIYSWKGFQRVYNPLAESRDSASGGEWGKLPHIPSKRSASEGVSLNNIGGLTE